MSFDYDETARSYECELFEDMVIYVMCERRDTVSVFLDFDGKLTRRNVVSVVDGNLTIQNPYFMKCSSEYLNENKFPIFPLYSNISLGTNVSANNQGVEGTFNADKNWPIGYKKGQVADVYAKAWIETSGAFHKSYIKECHEEYSRKQIQVMDKTNLEKVCLSDRETKIFRQVKNFVKVKLSNKYDRHSLIKDYNEFYEDEPYKPKLTLGKVSSLYGAKKNISTKQNFIDYVENWLDARLN